MAKIHIVTTDAPPGFDTRGQAEGAIPNGSEILKCNSEINDTHQDGTIGIVCGSIELPEGVIPKEAKSLIRGNPYGYFIEWKNSPIRAMLGHDPVVFTMGFKVALA